MSVLIIADHDHKILSSSTLHMVTAAKEISAEIDIAIVGCDCQAVAEKASEIVGVRSILLGEDEAYAHQAPEMVCYFLSEICEAYTHVICADSSFGKNILPRLAAIRDSQAITGVSKILGPAVFERPIYAGNAIATVETQEKQMFLSIRSTSFEPTNISSDQDAIAKIVSRDVVAPENKVSRFLSQKLSESERPELTEANCVVSGGRGVGSRENFDLIERLADCLGAAVGASRAAVDSDFISNDYQVGQTGKIVAPSLYIAIGISGAIQHIAGIKDSKTIIAINKDPDAPIFTVADYGLVGDLFEIVPELIEKLSAE